MSGRRTETVRSKNRGKKLNKKFLLTSKKRWLIEQSLLPLYQHLVYGYSDKLRDDIDTTSQVKEEPRDDLLESQSLQQSSSTNNPEVRHNIRLKSHFLEMRFLILQFLN